MLPTPSGKPSHNLLVLAKKWFSFELRNIIHKQKELVAVVKENVPIEINGSLASYYH
jgi:two-component system CheB/CheR fusion protein